MMAGKEKEILEQYHFWNPKEDNERCSSEDTLKTECAGCGCSTGCSCGPGCGGGSGPGCGCDSG
jgi:hypothetical protein